MASSRPFSLRSTSVQSVNRFSLFQVLSPCLKRTSFSPGDFVPITYRYLLQLPDRGLAGIRRRCAERAFNTQQLVVFGGAVGAAGRTCLDLTRAGRDGEFRDRGVLGLAGSVGN